MSSEQCIELLSFCLSRLNEAIDFIEEADFNDNEVPVDEVKVILHPPNDGEGSEADSGDEEFSSCANFSKEQLEAKADVEIITSEVESNDKAQTPLSKKRKTLNWERNEFPSTAFDLTVKNDNLESAEPMDYFNLFFDDQILDFILKQSIEYSGEIFTVDELKATLGVLLASGICQLPKRRDYWSTNDVLRNCAISSAIGQKRFETIFSRLHFVPRTVIPAEGDKFQKVRLLVSMLNKRFLENGFKTECFSVDEAIVPYYGRHSCKQFIRGKPLRFGYKLWVVACPNGYVFNVQPYPGVAEKANDRDLGSSANVVWYFANILRTEFPGQKMSFTFDNYFTSVSLLENLKKELGILATGTIRANRVPNLPVEKSFHKGPRGASAEWVTDGQDLCLTAWNDNKMVLILSSSHGHQPERNVGRYSRKEKKRIDVCCPASVVHYNKTMGGVDQSDANISRCRTAIRGKKWYYPIFLYLLDLAVSNAWILFKNCSPTEKAMSIANFRCEIALNLLSHNRRGKRPISKPPSDFRYSQTAHLIMYTPQQNRCAVCQKKANFFCEGCKKVLHPKECFHAFHTKS